MRAARHALHRLARRLLPAKRFIVAAGLLGLLAAVYGVAADGAAASPALRAGIVGALWCGLLFACIELFQRPPPRPAAHHGWRRRLALKAGNVLYSALALLVAGIGLFLLSMSVRLLVLEP